MLILGLRVATASEAGPEGETRALALRFVCPDAEEVGAGGTHGIEPGVGVLHLGLVGYSTQAFEDRDPLDAGRIEDPDVPQAAVETEDIAHPRLGQAPRAGTALSGVDVLVCQLDPPPRVRLFHGTTKVRGRLDRERLPGRFRGGRSHNCGSCGITRSPTESKNVNAHSCALSEERATGLRVTGHLRRPRLPMCAGRHAKTDLGCRNHTRGAAYGA